MAVSSSSPSSPSSSAPYPVRKNGEWHDVKIGGHWYLTADKGFIDSATHDANTHIPDAAITRMARWNVRYFPAQADSGASKGWLAGMRGVAPGARYDQKDAVLIDYTTNADPSSKQDPFPGVPNVNPLSGVQAIANAIGTLVGAITSAQFWLRAGEVLLGLVLFGVGAAHLSPAAGDKLAQVPAYGKLLKVAMAA
jgi:hypothetical protein